MASSRSIDAPGEDSGTSGALTIAFDVDNESNGLEELIIKLNAEKYERQ